MDFRLPPVRARVALAATPLFVALATACSSSSSPSGSGDAATGDAASCVTTVQGVIDVCGTSRKCEHLEYEKLCQSGNAATVDGVFRCFGANMCWIPGDENSAGPCIDAAVHATDPQADAFAASFCALCPTSSGGCTPISSFGIAPWYLAPSAADALRSCVSGAASCNAATQCLTDAAAAAGFNPNPTTC